MPRLSHGPTNEKHCRRQLEETFLLHLCSYSLGGVCCRPKSVYALERSRASRVNAGAAAPIQLGKEKMARFAANRARWHIQRPQSGFYPGEGK